MAYLPKLPHNYHTARQLQDSFGGLDYRPGAINGAIRDTWNMESDKAPMLSSRRANMVRANPGSSHHRGMISAGALYEVIGYPAEGQTAAHANLYKDGRIQTRSSAVPPVVTDYAISGVTLTDTEKIMVAMGERIIIWPDKVEYDARIDPDTQQPVGLKQLESSVSATGLVFSDGTFNDEDAEMNTITHFNTAHNWGDYFKVGDAVEITGCTVEPRNNKTPIIREIDGNKLIFYENTFFYPEEENQGSGEGTSTAHTVTETGSVTLARKCPDLDYMCVNENRVWGCKGDTIWCSKLGDPANWNVFDGLSTDSWSVESGTAGTFTACCSFMGYPCFFKENKIFKVYGSRPQNFELLAGADIGVKEGSAESMAVAGNMLIYLSPRGFVSWSGGMPSPIDAPLYNTPLLSAVGGSDGKKYWASVDKGAGGKAIFCYDPSKNMWHREDYGGIEQHDGNLFKRMRRHGSALVMAGDWYVRLKGMWPEVSGGGYGWYYEDETDSGVLFSQWDMQTFDSKYPVRLWLRAGAEEGVTMAVYVLYEDPEDVDWETAQPAAVWSPGKSKTTVYLPVPIKRCDHWSLAIMSDGPWWLWAVEQEYYTASRSSSTKKRDTTRKA